MGWRPKGWEEPFRSFLEYLIYRVMYWSLLFVPLCVAFWQKWITEQTKIPAGINAFVSDETSLWLFVAIFLANFILAGIACLFSKQSSFIGNIMELAFDDMAKIMVELTAVWSWMIVFVLLFIERQNLVIMVIGLVELPVFAWFGWLSVFKIRSSHAPSPARHDGCDDQRDRYDERKRG